MSCNFNIPFSGSSQQILNRARTAVQGQGGTFTGDESSGNFNVSVFGSTIKGSYNVMGNELNITITDKPFLIPCKTIEGYLRKEMS